MMALLDVPELIRIERDPNGGSAARLGDNRLEALRRHALHLLSHLKNWYLLTVPGRKSGQPRTTPIAVVEQDGKRYLLAPYGVVD